MCQSLPVAIFDPWGLSHAVKIIGYVCSKGHVLFLFAFCLPKLHLNQMAILIPDHAHLRNWVFMGVFGVVTYFLLTHWTH
jgi:hypothetical protein